MLRRAPNFMEDDLGCALVQREEHRLEDGLAGGGTSGSVLWIHWEGAHVSAEFAEH